MSFFRLCNLCGLLTRVGRLLKKIGWAGSFQTEIFSDFSKYFFTITDCDINTTAINNTHINYTGKLTNAPKNFELDFMCQTTGQLVDDDDDDDNEAMLFLYSREDFFRNKFFF